MMGEAPRTDLLRYSRTCPLTSPQPGMLLLVWVLSHSSAWSLLTTESDWLTPSLPSGLCSKLTSACPDNPT